MIPSENKAQGSVIDGQYNELSELVTANGPYYLIRGMTQLEANDAILACIKQLIKEKNQLIHNVKELCSEELQTQILQMELPHARN